MRDEMMKRMERARALVTEGRLAEATALLSGGGPSGDCRGEDEAASTPGARHPMRDVTPRTPAAKGRIGPPEAVRTRGEDGTARGRETAPDGDRPGPAGRAAAAAARAGSRWPSIRTPRLDGLLAPSRGTPAAARRAPPPPPGASFEERTHTGPHGALQYKLFVPSRGPVGAPLLVMLHGCTQGPDDFALGTRMNALAEREGMLVAYPRQVRAANANLCWNWFEPAHQGLSGEPGMIAGMAGDLVAEGADRARTFAAGLSAGGAMAALLGRSHAGVFSAVGVHSGLAPNAAGSLPDALAAMRSGASGRPIRARAIVIHGDRDATVAPANAEAIAAAGRKGARPRLRRGEAGGRAHARWRFEPTAEAGALEMWRVEGLGHAWSGGSIDGSHADPAGLDASAEMVRFFLRG